MNKAAKHAPVDLSEYAAEKIPFDRVIRRIAKAKPVHVETPKKSVKKPATGQKKSLKLPVRKKPKAR